MNKTKTPLTVKPYEDFVIDEMFELGSHFLDRDEVISFAKMWDPMPFHIDEEAAKKSIFGGLTASGSHLAAIRIKIIQEVGVNPYIIAALGWDKVRFILPGRVGDTLSLSYGCIEKRESKSKPDRGIVTLLFEMHNQESALVMSMHDTVLVNKRHTET